MTFELFSVWSNLCSNCCGNTGIILHGICKYEKLFLSGERIVAHGPLVSCSFIINSRINVLVCMLSDIKEIHVVFKS